MREKPLEKIEEGRFLAGEYASPRGAQYGAFKVVGPKGAALVVLSSGPDQEYGWEHVSVSIEHRAPNWQEMCWVKDMFWDDEEIVIQYHPRKEDYVNCHPNCLHLWRPMRETIPTPPPALVGPK